MKAGIIEIAKQFANGERPERSVVFLAVTLEESGLLGSKFYVAQPSFPLERTVALSIHARGLKVILPNVAPPVAPLVEIPVSV